MHICVMGGSGFIGHYFCEALHALGHRVTILDLVAPRFHVIAPDYQGFGNSDRPDPAVYAYSFEAISVTIEKFLALKGFDHYGLFMQDYGGPVGFRMALAPLLLEQPCGI